MADSKKKNTVPFSVRFERKLFNELDSYLNAIPREERPTKDAAIQNAVRRFLGTGTKPLEEGEQTNKSMNYNLHVVRQKSQKVVEIMGEIVSELSHATGEELAPTATDPDEQTIHHLAEENRKDARRFSEHEKKLQEDKRKTGESERHPDTKVAGGKP